MTQSEQINELVAALAKAQLEFQPVHKESDNPYYLSQYADLATVIKATQTALAKNGLVVTQWPMNDSQLQEAGVISELAHSSGQWKRMELILPATGKAKDGGPKYDAHTIGAAITYARRYTYQAIVGVAAEVDDDANSISEPSGSKEAAQAVATRKIAEHADRQKNQSTPTDGKAQETIVLTPYGHDWVALSGPGLSIVRANMTKDDKSFFSIKLRDKTVFCLDERLIIQFQDLCTRIGVAYVWKGMSLPKAKIPPPPVFPDELKPARTNDPILQSARLIEKQGKKPFMSVQWNGREHSTFDRGLWPILEAAVGKSALLEVKANGKYSNLIRILRMDGIDFMVDMDFVDKPDW